MSNVYILVDDPRASLNFLPAEKFGKLKVVYPHPINPTQLRSIYTDLEDKLLDINEEDYLLPTGPPALIALAGYLWMDILGSMKILTWDRATQQYYAVEELAREHDY
jgi:hypothetical protein